MLAGVSVVALGVVIGMVAFLWPSGGRRHLPAANAQTFAQRLAGDWVDVSDPKNRVTFDADNVVLSGVEMVAYKTKDAAQTFEFTAKGAKEPVTWSGHLGGDGRLYCRQAGNGFAIVLAREHVEVRHTPAAADLGQPASSSDNADRAWDAGSDDADRTWDKPGQSRRLGPAAGKVGRARLGMNAVEVRTIMGPPTDSETYPNGELMILTYGRDPAHATKVFFCKDGHPVGTVTLITEDGLNGRVRGGP